MEYLDETQFNKWYDNKVVVGLLIFFFFPVGIYALWKSRTISKGWKVGWSLIVGIGVISYSNSNSDNLNTNTKPIQQASLNSLNQDSLQSYLMLKYDVTDSWTEEFQQNGTNQLKYTIVEKDWVLITKRTPEGSLTRIECSGKDWIDNRELREVCASVSNLVDPKIAEFADPNLSALIRGESIPTYREFYNPSGSFKVNTIVLGSLANYIIEFK